MNILLLYPEMPNTIGKFASMVDLTGRKSAFPPVGLLTVASLLPKDWGKRVVDLNVDKLNESDLIWADYAFVSAMNVQAKSAKEVIELCNQAKLKVVAGGPLFTHEYEKFPGVDYFVLNEAEITLPEFINDLESGNPKDIYKTDKFTDMHTVPVPMWELVDVNSYLYAVVQYSRGCPYLCDFCDVTALFGRVPRTKTPEQIIAELDKLMLLGSNEMIFFADDNLIGNKNKLKQELLPALIEWRGCNLFAPAFATQLTINLADDDEMMQLMLEAGFRHILIGIESIDTETLVRMRKKQNVNRNILDNIKLFHAKGFVVIGTFIVGLDNDKEDVFDNLINFIQLSGIVLVVVNVLKAPPGTDLYERMVRENRLLEDFEFDEDRTNIIPVMDISVLHNGYKHVLEEVYNPRAVYERIIQYYSDKKPFDVRYPLKRRITFKDLKRAIKIVYNLGFVYKDRKYFWLAVRYTIKFNYNYLDLTTLYCLLMFHYGNLLERFLEKEEQGVYIYSSKLSA